MLDVFINVIMPVFLVAVLAAAFQRWRKSPVGPLSQVTLYLLTPALIFTSLVQQEIPPSATFRIVATLLVANSFIIATSLIVSFALRHDRAMRSAFVLSTGFPNAGNMALPVLLLAFGEEGLAVGVIVFVTMAIMGQSLGVFIAAGEQPEPAGVGEADLQAAGHLRYSRRAVGQGDRPGAASRGGEPHRAAGAGLDSDDAGCARVPAGWRAPPGERGKPHCPP